MRLVFWRKLNFIDGKALYDGQSNQNHWLKNDWNQIKSAISKLTTNQSKSQNSD